MNTVRIKINYVFLFIAIIANIVINVNCSTEIENARSLESNNTIKFDFLMNDVMGVSNMNDNVGNSLLLLNEMDNFGGNYSNSAINATSTINPTNIPTTDIPTNIPSISTIPSNVPSSSPSYNLSIVPTISLQPSIIPTISVEPSKIPTNGKCL